MNVVFTFLNLKLVLLYCLRKDSKQIVNCITLFNYFYYFEWYIALKSPEVIKNTLQVKFEFPAIAMSY
jgi:hypothetical protein